MTSNNGLKSTAGIARSGVEIPCRPAAKTVTIRHLFTHTSGLGYGFTSPVVRDFKPREGEKYDVGPLLFEPGTQWIYGTSVDWHLSGEQPA